MQLLHDLRFASRSLRRSPAFALIAVLILTFGIGVSAATWTVLRSVVLLRLPVRDQDGIVLPRIINDAGSDLALRVGEVDQLQRDSRTMREIAGVAHAGAFEVPLMDGERQVHLNGSQVYGNLFEVLGARPLLGRLLRPQDDSTSHVMVLSYRAWQREFGGSPAVIGRELRQTWLPVPYTIVGVAQPGLDYPVGTDYWVPLPFPQLENVVARLAPGATSPMARDEFLTLMRRLRHENIRSGDAEVSAEIRAAVIETLPDAVVGKVRPALGLITAAVALLLLIMCVNLGTLSLLRAAARSRELAIRRALGAAPLDLLRPLIAESVILGTAGCGLGLLCADSVRRGLVALAPTQLPRLDELRLAGAPVGAVTAIGLFTVLVFGFLPAVGGLRPQRTTHLRSVGGQSATRNRRHTRQLLVASEVALALILVTGAALLVRSLGRLDSIELGYEPHHLSVLSLSIPVKRIKTEQRVLALWDAVAPQLAAVRGVTAATPILIPPLMGPNFWSFSWQADWQSVEQAHESPNIAMEVGGPDFFRTFHIPILRGRAFMESDRASAPYVAVVSQSVARRLWPGADPIGRRIRSVDDTVWSTVVGVAADTHLRSLREPTPTVYVPYTQAAWQGHIALRTSVDLGTLVPSLRRAVSRAYPDLFLWTAEPMDDYLAVPLAQPRLDTVLVSVFGIGALLLAALGLYGVMSSAVREQTREIGVRIALGATSSRLQCEIVGQALRVAGAGALVGLVGAMLLTRLARSLLFEISPADPLALAGACAILGVVSLIAASVPANQASKVDAARALQTDA